MKLLRHISLCLVVCVCASCKDNTVTSIPSLPVALEFNMDRDAPTLLSPGGVATFIKPKYVYQYVGYGGVVVFHNFEDTFVAFDLACPNEVDANVRLNVDSIPGEAICQLCGSIFDIGYSRGYPIAGPCKCPMRQYGVMVDATNNVHVYN